MSSTPTITLTRTCGHDTDYTRHPQHLPELGEVVSCWSACDHVPAYRGANNPSLRRAKRIEITYLSGGTDPWQVLEPSEPDWKAVREEHLAQDPSAVSLWTEACHLVAQRRASHGAALFAALYGEDHPVTDYLLSHSR